MSAEDKFPIVMRGYNRADVDKAIADLQREVMEANTERSSQALEIKRISDLLEVFEADAVSGDKPTYAGLGAKLEQVLRTAEEQSTQLISTSDIEAQRILAAARAEAERLVSSAQATAASIVAEAESAATLLSSNAAIDAANIVEVARKDADATREAAVREATRVRGQVATEAAEMRATTQRETSTARANAEREITELRLVLDKETTEARAEIARLRAEAERAKLDLEAETKARRVADEERLLELHRDAVAQNEHYLTQVNREYSELTAAIEERKHELNGLDIEIAKRDAQATFDRDKAAADVIRAAEERASAIISEADEASRKRVDEAERRLAELRAERDGIADYVANLRDAVTNVAKLATD
ncbi:hypothetical protein C8A06_0201 [Microbacteriaceae bacterium MWH-Ta3]|nr:hypothetical protein C8A06_0201 [Microbacteriaceae bacterium MWH-Ta3]